ncbi:MAG: hydantoinase/oxoprolinase family protein [Hyphomicrobiaceae bacterium]
MSPSASDIEGIRLAVDIGGTFTDIVIEHGGDTATRKVLTTPRAPERAVIDGTLELMAETGLSPADLSLFIHGTTLATNAIIERKGAQTALIATEGFRDTLDIGDESRFDQYDIFIEKPVPLVPRALRFTVPERVDARGDVLLPLDETAVRRLATELGRRGIASIAVAYMHAYANPAHEQWTRAILQAELPGVSVTLSSEVCPELREYERTSTAVANAYVQPLMAGYLGRLRDELAEKGFRCPLYLMTSGGGLTTLETARRFPIRLVESGPAGGAILATHIAGLAGESKVLSFDMGGTTAKICLIEDMKPQASRSFEVDRAARFLKGSGLPLRIPVIEMVEIGAGGGSIAHVDAMRRITVGPESAGSEPGPASYGRGGTHPTVTDADLVLGRIDPARFAAGRLPLEERAARQALDTDIGGPLGLTTPVAAYGVAEIVDENMANAARVHAVERGRIIADHTIIAFGGAAPLHAGRLAEKLGIARVIVPRNAGVGSAVGFLRAPIAFEVVRSRHMRLAAFDAALANRIVAEMRAEAEEVVRAGAGERPLEEVRQAFMRYVGQGHEVVVALPRSELDAQSARNLRAAFEREYAQLFSRIIPGAEIEILSWTLSLATAGPSGAAPATADGAAPGGASAAEPVGTRMLYDPASGGTREVKVYWRASLAGCKALAGPALVAENDTTTFVPAGFTGLVDRNGALVLDRAGTGKEDAQ